MSRIKDLEYFNYLRENNIWCNAKIISSDGIIFPVHSAILMASSGYFWAAFQFGPQGGKLGSARSKVSIPCVDGATFDIIVRFIYLDQIELDRLNLWTILRAADFLQIYNLVQRCLGYLNENMCFSTCCSLLQITQRNLYLPSVKNCVLEYALENICEPRQPMNERYQAVTSLDLDILLTLLSSDSLNAPHEELVWEAIVWWLDSHDTSDEYYHVLRSFLEVVRIGLLTPGYFSSTVMRHPSILSQRNLMLSLKEREREVCEWRERDTSVTDAPIPIDVVPRLPHELVLVFGGWAAEGPSSEVFAYDIDADRWTHVTELESSLHSGRTMAYHGIAQLDNTLYIVGGTEFFDESNHDTSRCYRVDLDTLTEETIAPLSIARNFVSCASVAGRVYALGGRESTHRRHCTGEVFDPTTGRWSPLPNNMHHVRSDASIAVIDNKIYMIGGYTGGGVLASVECLDIHSGVWQALPDMHAARSGARCVAFQDHIFVFGGFSGDTRLRSIERYDTVRREWIMLAPMSVGRSNMAAVVVRNSILVMGGYSGQSIDDIVELYDIYQDTWHLRTPLPTARSALNAITVKGFTQLTKRILGERRDVPELTVRNPVRPLLVGNDVGLPRGRPPQIAINDDDWQLAEQLGQDENMIEWVIEDEIMQEEAGEEDNDEWAEAIDWNNFV